MDSQDDMHNTASNHSQAIGETFAGIDFNVVKGSFRDDLVITSITADSRKVTAGSIFVAVRGLKSDGHRFIEQAVKAGAVVVVAEQGNFSADKSLTGQAVVVTVEDTELILAYLAANYYQHPAKQLFISGVTGTNGKTTVTYLIERVLKELEIPVGVIGTIEYRFPDPAGELIIIPAPFTTPDPILLHAVLRRMVDNGVSHVIMEVSSHALEQKRLGPITFSQALFTNFSQDHLDYHHSMEDYFEAKCLLFREHSNGSTQAIIYDPDHHDREKSLWAQRLVTLCKSLQLPVVTCGDSAQSQVRLNRCTGDRHGIYLEFLDSSLTHRILSSPLVGRFNVENLLLAYTALEQMRFDSDRVCSILSTAPGAPGRLDPVSFHQLSDNLPSTYVDYAHTPDALEKVLQTLKKLPHRTLFCVFGCGGDRDRSKRPLMAEIAVSYSDVVIVTDDNPRTEDPDKIRQDIIEGVETERMALQPRTWLFERAGEAKGVVEIGDRARAIEDAVRAATSDDIVLIAGKGHEQYQIIGQEKSFFDDRLAACQASIGWDEQTISNALKLDYHAKPGATTFTEISTDTREIKQSAVFVALKGDNFNGHDFINLALDKGAACLIVSERPREDVRGTPVLSVPDTLRALGDLARWRRSALRQMTNPVVVGITGSCGKTTVKEMTASIMEQQWPERIDRPVHRVLKTQGNFNNLIGLPLTLLPASVTQRGVILEMGMNQFGEIERLTEIGDPDIACITNIASAHLEGLGNIEGVARAKGELFQGTGDRAIHVVNLDDSWVVKQAKSYTNQTIRFGISDQALAAKPDVWATETSLDSNGMVRFRLHVGGQNQFVRLNSPGMHNCINGCAAAAIGVAAGIDIETIVEGLQQFQPAPNRMAQLMTPAGLNLLNDTYNANPVSMSSAISTLAGLSARKRVAILGDMLELGETSNKLHHELGQIAAAAGLDLIAVTGNFSEHIRRGALDAGMNEHQVISFNEKQRVVDWVKELVHSGQLQSNDWILLKASRGLALDTVVEDLMQDC
ncbi:MAG: UDP-N-acetylmuramoyl-L-alanyl-D-glutamate--2,6-diaminopimelate ligase [Desulfobulbaceae bacterium]|nr:MAG: UDP-N-acetylmuramoyl-L-alanyl-D-glutamate--2,6-diaminopimelate ligase [Desulfobulbaceae bacterium]